MIVDVVSQQHRAWLRQAARTLVSVFLSAAVSQLFGLREAPWALITAAIVTSSSVTGTWAAGRDQITGTLIGAAAGAAAIGLELLHYPRMPVFWIILAPLALLAAARPTLRLTCVTLVVVFLFPSPGRPFDRPVDRVAAILTGALVSLAVSYVVFRSRARAQAFGSAREMLGVLRQLLQEVMSGRGPAASRDILNDAAIAALRSLGDAVIEARREHVSTLEQADPLLVRLVPMLRRLQSDVLFVTRAMDELPDANQLRDTLASASQALTVVFDGLARRCQAIEQGVRSVQAPGDGAAEIANLDDTLTSLGDTAGVPLRFTLQMLRRDLDDMETAILQDGQEGATGVPARPVAA